MRSSGLPRLRRLIVLALGLAVLAGAVGPLLLTVAAQAPTAQTPAVSNTLTAGRDVLRLTDESGRVEAWPVTTVLFDAERRLTVRDVSAALDRFQRPTTSYATLGANPATAWLHIPVEVDPGSNGDWILDIDYAPLDVVDVFVQRGADIEQRAAIGSRRPFGNRPLHSRTHSVPLLLQSSTRYDLFIRAESSGTLILPITLNKPTTFHAEAVKEQMLQGVLTGLGLCLLLYSLTQWLVLREPFFLKYAVLISGSLLFSLLQFGIGMQFLWTDHFTLERHAGGTAALIAMAGSFLFIEQAVSDSTTTTIFQRLMKGGAIGSAAIALLFQFDLVPDSFITALVSVLGPVPALMGMPGAVRMVRRGNPIGAALLVAWLVYFVTTGIIIGVIGGVVPANFWTLHAFQFGATFDMVAFTYVLGLRTKAVREVAQRASVERDLMRSLAITDPLTGLTNRRGLGHVLDDARTRRLPYGVLALYLIDVDGFKAVNDRDGHEAGDELLVQISNRLRAAVRGSDIVARLGGDEFVVVADGLSDDALAEELGLKLVGLADEPFALTLQTVRIGLTVGYALSPPLERDPATLLKYADAAMYDGKRAGKRCLRRASVDRPERVETPAIESGAARV